MLQELPRSAHPDLLVGFDTHDDAGVFRVSDKVALVQTMDFFTPIVDDPYAYGTIAAANALSDVYAMGGKPLTVMNICCFDPAAAPPAVWAAILRGMADKVTESGATTVGGHTVEDKQPKFGLSVTGVIDPSRVMSNAGALPGDLLVLTKPIGTGIVTTAAKFDDCPPETLAQAIDAMSTLNAEAAARALEASAKCATDITGFGLAGHLLNICRASKVTLQLDADALPIFEGVEKLVEQKNTTAGAKKNALHVGDSIQFHDSVPAWIRECIFDPQTSGGLAIAVKEPIPGFPTIGRFVAGDPKITVR